MEPAWINAILGGLIIGAAASAFLLLEGRVLGVSGITGHISELNKGDTLWRILFVLGALLGGFVASQIWPENFSNLISGTNYPRLAMAGLLVGFGTKMGNGCTSGHGVCGIGRLSPRGVVATVTFMALGILTVVVIGR
ncbi:MAG: YeeE/YedE thiosulfate transporter family protein [bacterium]|jgi:uncharacterized protein